jgi:hyperosmotically inducible protein
LIIYKRLASICFSIALVAGLAACDKEGPAESAGKSIDQAVEKTGDKMEEVSKNLGEKSDTMGKSMDDTLITTKVKEAIFAEPGLKVLQITVNTTNGVVTLSGSVDSDENSERAKETAGKVAGVKSVNNELVLK